MESIRVTVEDGLALHCLRWGASATKRGLLMVHGGGASAVWWKMVAPFFADEFDVVAVSNSGNGDSDVREAYTIEVWAGELAAVCEKLGFFDAERPKPYILAHSLGGGVSSTMLLEEAKTHDDSRFGGFIMVDFAVRSEALATEVRDRIIELRKNDPSSQLRPGWPRQPREVQPLERFKLRPFQSCENLWMLRWIAESSVTRYPDGSWHWKGDANREARMSWQFPIIHDRNFGSLAERMPVCWMYGEDSILCDPAVQEFMRKELTGVVGLVGIPRAQHHVWLDAPEAFIAAVRGVLAGWQSIPFKERVVGSGGGVDEDDKLNKVALLEAKL